MKEKPFAIQIDPEAQKEIDAIIQQDPAAGEWFKDLFAKFHQASASVRSGQYTDMGAALKALGVTAIPVEPDA